MCYSENSNFPNVVILYTVRKEVLAQMFKENSPLLREVGIVIAFCLLLKYIFFEF